MKVLSSVLRSRARCASVIALVVCGALAGPSPARAQAVAASAASPPRASDLGFGNRRYDFGAPPVASRPNAIQVPRVTGRLGASSLGLVINTADPYSVEVGEFYIRARGLKPAQVLRVALPVHAALTPTEFEGLSTAIQARFGGAVEALALAWTLPYAVNCNSITGALALGYDAKLCDQTCAPSKRSPYFDAASIRPNTDLQLRPSMLLAAPTVEAAKAMIRRGVASDGSLGLRGAPPVHAYFVKTADVARSSRAILFPPPGLLRGSGVEVHVESTEAIVGASRVLVYETGLTHVPRLDTLHWVPGALADHLTSFGGRLDGGAGQMPITEWIAAGATASYGTVSEPCSHPQKFPHPQVLLLNYLQGSTAIEAYWKSVAWPQQGVFIGEPLAAPFARGTAPPR